MYLIVLSTTKIKAIFVYLHLPYLIITMQETNQILQYKYKKVNLYMLK
jgi:hypothetical protein